MVDGGCSHGVRAGMTHRAVLTPDRWFSVQLSAFYIPPRPQLINRYLTVCTAVLFT